ncbi:sulfite exporter TauE/SafE family protein [Dyadobacter crusticola]|uniref:sulfite exporter TauE/SafE family protein n=1 Tax=Dyadobacter crusticola TaxID=292407 RepID=UPI000AA7E7B2|nr:sulfite exporter TauE/SafE family protein [Dyadobacter crusticola]
MNPVLPYLALTMGFMSSFHCIGMCGPIALALPVQSGNNWRQITALIVYNAGRILTYAALGAVIGLFGTPLAFLGYLQYLSVFAGALMLAYIIWPKRLNTIMHVPLFWQKWVGRIRSNMSKVIRNNHLKGRLVLGLLNGLLPCGLVYLALISSVATGSFTGGAMYMLLFGLGTFPAMMLVGIFRNRISSAVRSRLHQVTPIMIAIAGIWLIARGLTIHYPSSTQNRTEITVCHGK